MSIEHVFLTSLASWVGWTLFHSLWEGAVVTVMLAVALAALRRRSPQTKYLASVAAMGLLLVAVCVTFACSGNIFVQAPSASDSVH